MEIKTNNLTYKNLFKKINIEINDNKITSIIGKSGSGKTTLLNLIFGLYKEFEGYLIIDNKTINSEDELKKARKNISYLTQDSEDEMIYSNFRKNLSKEINNISKEKYEDMCLSLNLTDKMLKKSSLDLSDSELKRIMLLKTFIRNCNMIMLDDPTSNLDQKNISSLIKLIKREKNSGKTILIASNDIEFLLKVSDEIIVLENNKITKFNNKYNIFSNKEILKNINAQIPKIIEFKLLVNKNKKIKLIYRDNINDLIKDIYRNA